jgi:hypothetical protein
MKKIVIPILIFALVFSIFLFTGCGKSTDSSTETKATTEATTAKAPGKYADSEYLGNWYNAEANETFICKLNDDGTAIFKDDKKASWEETAGGLTITTTVEGESKTLNGYFVIAGDGFVARATEANMHYLDEGGELQLEIMLTENTCVDCIKK